MQGVQLRRHDMLIGLKYDKRASVRGAPGRHGLGHAKTHCASPVGTRVLVGVLVAMCLGACGGSVAQPSASPSTDSIARNYVALVHAYWASVKAGDNIGGIDADAIVCLGNKPPPAQTDLQLVDPPKCQQIAVVWLDVHQKFLVDLEATPAPAKFASDDGAIRAGLPKAVVDLKSLIVVASTNDKAAVRQATIVYINDMIPTVTSALDDIDPTVVHN
jgi:hypothetical protein